MSRSNLIFLLRALLSLAFLYYGFRKLGGFPAEVAIYEAIGFGQFPRFVTGSVEVGGAILLWVRGWRGVAGLILLSTVCIGLAALLIWVGPPYWHMLVLITASAAVAIAHRNDIISRIPRSAQGH
ncbi:hypothetical protein [Yoonia sp.]|uniref:hypothetical protein n=1 Tax=Yoonia sp. TaxID=2212373 RepID=UPI002FDACD89